MAIHVRLVYTEPPLLDFNTRDGEAPERESERNPFTPRGGPATDPVRTRQLEFDTEMQDAPSPPSDDDTESELSVSQVDVLMVTATLVSSRIVL